MPFVLVQAGSFFMGSPEQEPGHQPDERLHRVAITQDFYVGVHEVTRGQWHAVMRAHPPASDADLPVVGVNWFEVQDFLERLRRTTGRALRLPTESEWEYVCRAGTTTPYAFGATLSTDQANYNGTFPLPGQASGLNRGALTAVGTFSPNAWGLFDLHGNVWEWTADAYCPYPEGEAVNPRGTCDGPLKTIRGGSWRFNADSARCGLRYTHAPADRGDSLGFRVVMEPGTRHF
jgi:formylglycine-generating enzyme